jgi:uncharacterized protein (TIGR00299 family) protein
MNGVRTAYFDCFSGISGDMILGALVDLGADLNKIRAGLKTLDLDGYKITRRTVRRGLLSGTKIHVVLDKTKRRRPPSRHFKDIKKLLENSGLPKPVKARAVDVFHRIARAEAAVHGESIDRVHFHEVGAIDSIVDITGGLLALDNLGISRVLSSPINVGEGFVTCEHGMLPVPAPATLRLLEGIPCFSTGVPKELATPTGAGMIATLSEGFGPLPAMTVLGSGYGAGGHIIPTTPNMLRVILGECGAGEGTGERLAMVETQIDDMNPEFYGPVMERLFDAGAVDVTLTPLVMKKGRPATKISTLVGEAQKSAVIERLLRETSTFGVRFHEVGRVTLAREVRVVETSFGAVEVKLGILADRVIKVAPEYEACRKIAKRQNQPLQTVYDAARRAAGKFIGKKIGTSR